MTSDPAERFAVESAQVGEPHAADGQHRLAVTTADLEPPVLALRTQTQPQANTRSVTVITLISAQHKCIHTYRNRQVKDIVSQ